jgi:hypothetical protein
MTSQEAWIMRRSQVRSNQGIGLGAEGAEMDILNMAREAGFAVLLDGRIGQEEYSTVSGSKEALQCFAEAVRIAAERERDRSDRSGWLRQDYLAWLLEKPG